MLHPSILKVATTTCFLLVTVMNETEGVLCGNWVSWHLCHWDGKTKEQQYNLRFLQHSSLPDSSIHFFFCFLIYWLFPWKVWTETLTGLVHPSIKSHYICLEPKITLFASEGFTVWKKKPGEPQIRSEGIDHRKEVHGLRRILKTESES